MVIDHNLVPNHEILSDNEAEKVLEKYKIVKEQLPKIAIDDPAIKEMEPKVGDIVKILRTSKDIGNSVYYRVVI